MANGPFASPAKTMFTHHPSCPLCPPCSPILPSCSFPASLFVSLSLFSSSYLALTHYLAFIPHHIHVHIYIHIHNCNFIFFLSSILLFFSVNLPLSTT
ncbi:MAG: hypothetical protein BYD32DRAFT_79574 [Podila humilis]|nr:MAG: hypothetical protein BYD32DRAFT_79574 [Podila humilis]